MWCHVQGDFLPVQLSFFEVLRQAQFQYGSDIVSDKVSLKLGFTRMLRADCFEQLQYLLVYTHPPLFLVFAAASVLQESIDLRDGVVDRFITSKGDDLVYA
ncbi:hypothetical protein ED92_17180 [Amycolatopsis sp. MJM2582]|nr:hypothetical protein ED92_17180 [Amycolatopsis sp. MJM2582]